MINHFVPGWCFSIPVNVFQSLSKEHFAVQCGVCSYQAMPQIKLPTPKENGCCNRKSTTLLGKHVLMWWPPELYSNAASSPSTESFPPWIQKPHCRCSKKWTGKVSRSVTHNVQKSSDRYAAVLEGRTGDRETWHVVAGAPTCMLTANWRGDFVILTWKTENPERKVCWCVWCVWVQEKNRTEKRKDKLEKKEMGERMEYPCRSSQYQDKESSWFETLSLVPARFDEI